MSGKVFGGFKIEKASILVSDLRGFTYFSEKYPSLEVADLLNRFFNIMIPIIEGNGGVVDKLIGDSILAIFDFKNDDILNVLTCAIEMQNAMEQINNINIELNMPSIYMGIGINTGEVAVGYLGNISHHDFTVIGNEVNLASRVEAYSMRGQVLLSDNSFNLCKDNIKIGSRYDVHPKGKIRPLTIYELLEIKKPNRLVLNKENDRSVPRVKVNLLVNYRIVDKAKIISGTFEGQALDISYTGIKIKTVNKIELLTEVVIEVTSSIFGADKSSVYAKVKHSSSDNGHYISGLEFTVIDDAALISMKSFIDNSI